MNTKELKKKRSLHNIPIIGHFNGATKKANKQSNVYLLFSLILSTLRFKTTSYYILNCKYKLIP